MQKKAELKETVKATEVKAAAKAEEVKDAVKEAAAKTTETVVKTTETAAKKVETAANTAVKKAAVKKPAAKKPAVKRTAVKQELVPEVYIQFNSQEDDVKNVVNRAREAFVADGHKAASIKSLRIYLKPEEHAAYYVVNEKYAGQVDLL